MTTTISTKVHEVLYEIMEAESTTINSEGINEFLDSIDSLAFVSLIVKLEEQFGIEFPPESLLIENFNSLPKLLCIVEQVS